MYVTVPKFVAVGQTVLAYVGVQLWGRWGPRPIGMWAWLTPRNMLLPPPPVTM